MGNRTIKNNSKTKKKRVLTTAISLAVAFSMLVLPISVFAAGNAKANGKTVVADHQTVNDWKAIAENSTEHVGRIWTDKSVSKGEITVDGKTIAKQDGSDFLVGLSAISSTSNINATSSKPLDIVFVLDRSGSMSKPFGKVYANELDTSKTYYIELINGETRRVDYKNGSWGYGSWLRMEVTPKTSATDNNLKNKQFYTAIRMSA